MKNLVLAFLSLFTSFGTLFCCAIPALLVSLGMGASLAGLISSFPQLVWLSEYKAAVFGTSGGLIVLSGALMYRAKDLPCPTDPRLRAACLRGRTTSKVIFAFAVACFAVGSFFAFVAPSLL